MKQLTEAVRTLGFWRVLYYRVLYRPMMRLAHRYDWHYAPVIGPFEDGSTQRWCKWCGFRQSIPQGLRKE
jgi:hypothetical protein